MSSGKLSIEMRLARYLFVMSKVEELNVSLYSASEAGIQYDLNYNVSNRYLYISTYGYNQKLRNVLKYIIDSLQKDILDEFYFNKVIESLKKNLRNHVFSKPISLTYEFMMEDIDRTYIDPSAKLEALKTIDFNKVNIYGKQMINDFMWSMLYVNGNFSPSDVYDIADVSRTMIHMCPIQPLNPLKYRHIDDSKKNKIEKTVLNGEENDSAISCSYFLGYNPLTTTQEWLSMDISKSMLKIAISDRFFDQLRTKEQLGYMVYTYHNNYGSDTDPFYTFEFSIQSNVKDPEYLKERIDDFIKNFNDYLESMKDSEFSKYIETCKKKLLKPYSNIYSEYGEISEHIFCMDKIFDRKERMIEYLDVYTKSDLCNFYTKYIMSATPKVSSVYGNKHMDLYPFKRKKIDS